MTICILARISSGTLGSSLWLTKRAFASEWVRILVISFSESSVNIGTAMRPNAATENSATGQFGIFCERIATLSPEFIPKLDNWRDILRQQSPKEANV